MRTFLIVAAAMLLLAACGEAPQDSSGAKKPDDHASKGTNNGYSEPGWKAGDEKAWETQLKNRALRGQDEYQRTSGAS